MTRDEALGLLVNQLRNKTVEEAAAFVSDYIAESYQKGFEAALSNGPVPSAFNTIFEKGYAFCREEIRDDRMYHNSN